jgi:hypothetical protein
METKTCNRCGETKPTTKFPSRTLRCRKCADEIWAEGRRAENKDPAQLLRDRKNVRRALARLGLKPNAEWHTMRRTADERNQHYAKQLDLQGGVCAIYDTGEWKQLGGKIVALCRDHDRDTGEFRGLLTQAANTGIGFFGENTELLEKAALYMEKWLAVPLDQREAHVTHRRYRTNGKPCDICEASETRSRSGKITRPCQDHDAVTNTLRGVLCARCNLGLGHLVHDPVLIRKAAQYLIGWGRPLGVSATGDKKLLGEAAGNSGLPDSLKPTGNTQRGHSHYTLRKSYRKDT